jgi:hypothetical protein
MSLIPLESPQSTSPVALVTVLPGPDRKRSARAYSDQLTDRNPDPDASGCVMTWEVEGGRVSYQIALERDAQGTLRVHCTCADAIFRAEPEGRFCKHIHGFLHIGEQLQQQEEYLRLALRAAS